MQAQFDTNMADMRVHQSNRDNKNLKDKFERDIYLLKDKQNNKLSDVNSKLDDMKRMKDTYEIDYKNQKRDNSDLKSYIRKEAKKRPNSRYNGIN